MVKEEGVMMKTSILEISEPNSWGENDRARYVIPHGKSPHGVQTQTAGGDSFGPRRCGMCGLEWVAERHEDLCPLAELETVLLPEGWFCN